VQALNRKGALSAPHSAFLLQEANLSLEKAQHSWSITDFTTHVRGALETLVREPARLVAEQRGSISAWPPWPAAVAQAHAEHVSWPYPLSCL
jgi:hypothetical protein